MSDSDIPNANPSRTDYSRRELVHYSLRMLAGFALVFGGVLLLAHQYRSALEALGQWFVGELGFVGMTVGTLLADGLHFPIPPQAYMLMAVSSGASPLASFTAIAFGSFLGGTLAYFLGRELANFLWLREKLAPLQHMFDRMWDRFGHRALLFASIAPIPYSTVCWLTGLNRLPKSAYWVLAAFRVPRLIVFYSLIALGWRL